MKMLPFLIKFIFGTFMNLSDLFPFYSIPCTVCGRTFFYTEIIWAIFAPGPLYQVSSEVFLIIARGFLVLCVFISVKLPSHLLKFFLSRPPRAHGSGILSYAIQMHSATKERHFVHICDKWKSLVAFCTSLS